MHIPSQEDFQKPKPIFVARWAGVAMLLCALLLWLVAITLLAMGHIHWQDLLIFLVLGASAWFCTRGSWRLLRGAKEDHMMSWPGFMAWGVVFILSATCVQVVPPPTVHGSKPLDAAIYMLAAGVAAIRIGIKKRRQALGLSSPAANTPPIPAYPIKRPTAPAALKPPEDKSP